MIDLIVCILFAINLNEIKSAKFSSSVVVIISNVLSSTQVIFSGPAPLTNSITNNINNTYGKKVLNQIKSTCIIN